MSFRGSAFKGLANGKINLPVPWTSSQTVDKTALRKKDTLKAVLIFPIGFRIWRCRFGIVEEKQPRFSH